MVYFVIEKFENLKDYQIYINFILLVIGVMLSQHLFCKSIINEYYWRNYIFFGIPYFGSGLYIKKYEDVLLNTTEKISPKVMLGIICFFVIALITEWKIYLKLGSGTGELYFCLLPLCVCVFMYFRYYFVGNRKIEQILSRWGRDYSLIIYIVHPFFVSIINIWFVRVKIRESIIETGLTYICPIIVFGISLLTAFLYKKSRYLISGSGFGVHYIKNKKYK